MSRLTKEEKHKKFPSWVEAEGMVTPNLILKSTKDCQLNTCYLVICIIFQR